LLSWLWGLKATEGQSSFEVGRECILRDTSSDQHLSNWHVAVSGENVVGAMCSLPLADRYDLGDPSNLGAVTIPFVELEAVAKGTYHLMVASVFPEHRGKGVGHAILNQAADLGRTAGCRRLTLIVGSFNPRAQRLYERYGFRQRDRRPFVPFPGTTDSGDLILMDKDLHLCAA